jgi:hypothetical protein
MLRTFYKSKTGFQAFNCESFSMLMYHFCTCKLYIHILSYKISLCGSYRIYSYVHLFYTTGVSHFNYKSFSMLMYRFWAIKRHKYLYVNYMHMMHILYCIFSTCIYHIIFVFMYIYILSTDIMDTTLKTPYFTVKKRIQSSSS